MIPKIIKGSRISTIGFLIVSILIFFFIFIRPGPKKCFSGPLAKIDKCEKGNSYFSWMNSGWWFTKAEGIVSQDFCREHIFGKIGSNEPIVFHKHKEVIQLVPHYCSSYLVETDSMFDFCFTSSKPSSNYNTRYYWLLALDKDCRRGLFFRSSGRILTGGKIIEMSFPTPEAMSFYPEMKVLSDKPLISPIK